MHRKSYRKLSTFSLILGASALLAILPGCPPPFCTSDADCDDALFCNGVEICDDGACLSNGDACPADEICDEDNDVCILPCETDADCDDADACTDDACNDDGECDHTNSAAACDDGLFCTGTETCDSATGCVDGTDPCDPDTERCNEDTDSCDTVCGDDTDCDDGDACTIDTCMVADGTCANVAVDCDPAQACNVLTGACNTTCAVDSDCDDPLFCNGTETCADGLCQAGASPCSFGEFCREDVDECIPTVFFDDFEQGIGNWFADNGIWEVGVPSSGPNSAHSPEQLAATVLAGNYGDSTSSRLVSPSIQLPAINAEEEIHLRFWHWFAFTGGIFGTDSGVVQIREQTAPGEWTAWTGLESFVGSSGVFTQALVDLSGHAGKKIQIGLLLNNGQNFGTAPGWYIDDITIAVF